MLLRATDIRAGYSSKDVLNGISVHVESGEFVGLVGPNGCGKSTLLRAISRTLELRAGRADLDGKDVWSLTPLELARNVAFVPQQEPAHFDFIVRDVVMMGRYPHQTGRRGGTTDEDYAIVRQALADADVSDLEMRPVTQLSGGEHRRVLVARALAQTTPLMLLDEPTAHLDVTHQAELLTLIQRRVKETGLGAMAALHELNHAAEHCDRLVLLREGVVIDHGSPERVLTSENLRAAYGARARVGRNPVSGRPMILALSSLRDEEASQASPGQVHVICGGGTGFHILHSLLRAGYGITAGVLNESDTDYETAIALGVETATESPFSPISAGARNRAAAMIIAADTVLVTDVPFGSGNLPNLELAIEAQQTGKQVVLIDHGDSETRDYTGGIATRLMADLLQHGAQRCDTIEEWTRSVH